MPRNPDDIVQRGERKRWDNFVQAWEFDPNVWHRVRFFGPIWEEFRHVVTTKTDKRYYEYCHGWDIENGEFFADADKRCPCCALKLPGSYRYLSNLICLQTEEEKPANPRADWCPIYMIDCSSSLFKRLRELKSPNKDFNIWHPQKGAIVQIKFNPTAEAANMYSATMDEKNVPITEEQLAYTVNQGYPDGRLKTVKGKDGLPAMFEYIRCVNSRDEMQRSLQRHGYYENQEKHEDEELDFSSDDVKSANVAKVDAETAISPMSDDLRSAIAKTKTALKQDDEDEAPVPKASAPATKQPAAAAAPAAAKDYSSLAYEDCPTEFGKFANAMECFTQCQAAEACRSASAKKSAPSVKKVSIDEDEDDSV